MVPELDGIDVSNLGHISHLHSMKEFALLINKAMYGYETHTTLSVHILAMQVCV